MSNTSVYVFSWFDCYLSNNVILPQENTLNNYIRNMSDKLYPKLTYHSKYLLEDRLLYST